MRGGRGYRVFLGHPMRGTPTVPCFATQESQREPRLCRWFFVLQQILWEKAADTVFFWGILCEELSSYPVLPHAKANGNRACAIRNVSYNRSCGRRPQIP
eukprot:10205841-Karenia_brevis.AAC.1